MTSDTIPEHAAPMGAGAVRVAVVTPYYQEDNEVLRACLESVRRQTYSECRHFVVADGHPNPLVDDYQVTHIRLPAAHGDNGNFARCIGSFAAWSDGFDAIAFLDADNWYRPDHVERMVALQARTGVVLCTSGRSVHRLDGSVLNPCDRESDGVAFADTSCLCLFRPAFDLLALWGAMPKSAGPVCDKIMWDAVKLRGISRSHDPEPTVAFRSQYAFHYSGANEEPPAGAKSDSSQREAWAKFKALSYTQRIGLLLGVGGTRDIQSLLKAQPAKATQLKDVSVHGLKRTLRVEVPVDDGIDFVTREIFNHQQYRPIPGLPSPRAILDIGANVGLAAAYFRLVYPDSALVCVEPDPRAYELLARNARVIGNCVPVCAGLTLGMQTQSFHLGVSSVLNSVAAVSGQAGRMLMIDAERLVQDLQRQDFDLIKIDTEGAEIPILLSLRGRLGKTAVILLEFHSDSDRRIIDALLCDSHFLWHSTVTSPHRGNLCYVRRSEARKLLPDAPLT